ncbi:MAG: sulfurtransferase [Bacteroidales bacterium]|nr:sulfurtransferase [Bacteroidales bacterium]
MKNITKYLGLIVAFIFTATTISAQGDFISSKDFAKAVKSKNAVVISAQSAKNYKVSHIKNAVFIDHNDLYEKGAIEGLLLSPAKLAKYFGSKGVSETKQILIYDDGTNKYAARIYWILKYIGAPNVKILHKDMGAWRSARIMITKASPKVSPATFTPKVNKSIATDYNFVKASIGNSNVVLVDVRHSTEFDGTIKKPVSKGHIPGSVNLEWKKVENKSGALLPSSELQTVFTNAGITKGKTIVLYCGTSVRSGIVFVALKSLGYTKVKVYDGAYNEWDSKGGKFEK